MMQGMSSLFRTALMFTALLAGAAIAARQTSGQQPQQQPQQQPAPADKSNPPQAAPLTLEPAAPPVNAEEDAAIKTFRETKNDDLAKKNQVADDFLAKYPQSRYRPEVYAWQVQYFHSKGDIDKMEVAADKQLALFPNDPQTLAVVGSTLPRAMNANTQEPAKRLAKAEQYCQKALDLMPALVKPANVNDEDFQKAKNQAAALAYSGLGLVAFRRGKFADAIPHFEQSVKVDPSPDPVNYYLLGICQQKTSHFDDAVAAFTKCAAIPGGLQATCKNNIEEAKKLAATQLSAPK